MQITINGQAIEVQEGQTILEVARQEGYHIPTLCHLDGIHDTGACRVCVVEIEGVKKLKPACVTEVWPDIKVLTHSDRVLLARKTIVNMMLANGSHDCLSCEASGDCDLQDLAYELGIEEPAYLIDEPSYERDYSSEMIVRDENRCILCGKCVTSCTDIVVNDVLSFGGRGHDMRIIADFDKPLGDSTCVQCGECVQACPTGALINKKSMGKARAWEVTKVQTTCPYCGVGCQQILHIKDDKIVKITGAEDALPNQGRLCVKGRYGYEFINSRDRLTSPLIKEKGVFRKASWEEALDYTASRLKDIVDESGPSAVAALSSARSTNEDSYNLQKFMRSTLRSANIDHCARV